MAVITTGSHPRALWPGVHKWWGEFYNEHPMEYKQVFDVAKSKKSFELDVESTGFGLPVQKSEGGSVSYDSHNQGETKTYTHAAFGLNFRVAA